MNESFQIQQYQIQTVEYGYEVPWTTVVLGALALAVLVVLAVALARWMRKGQ